MITPARKLELIRAYEVNPSAAILTVMDILREEMRETVNSELEKIQKDHALELKQLADDVAKELKKEIPDLEKVLQTITGNDGEDSEPDEVATALLAMPEFLQMVRPEDGHTPTTEELLSLIQPLIPVIRQPEDGRTPSREALLNLIRPLIPIVENGRTPTKDELVAIITPLIPVVRDGSPDTGKEIVKKINELALNPEFQIDASHIKNLPRPKKDKGKPTLRGGGDIVNYYDLSSQCNGVLKTFIIPTNRQVLGVHTSQYPYNYRPASDWTVSGVGNVTLTLASGIDAPATGQNLYIYYIV